MANQKLPTLKYTGKSESAVPIANGNSRAVGENFR